MLTRDNWPANNLATTSQRVFDITEDVPIPRGAVVTILDFDTCGDGGVLECGDGAGYWIVEWNDRVYLAVPDELKI